MSLITVNEEKCIKCGMCVVECPTGVLKLEADGPKEVNPNACLECGHCVAVCPKEAIDNKKSPLAMQNEIGEIKKLDPEEAKNFIRTRRSIRSYKNIPVEREKLLQLVDVAHLAPTASNSQGVSFLIVDDKKRIELAVEECINWFDSNETLSKMLNGMISGYKKNKVDTILRDAPSIILTLADKDFRNGRENSILSLSYLELYAPSLGLGSCWAGIFEICALNDNSPMYKLFNIPENKKITGVVMVGYPKHSFKRFTERKPLEASFYEN
ncbi:nitroreductase/NAD-dependent dihydropyrimidine dehydrogenase PreA subunit [Clostridium saccharoperbutylacetonicum]|uniref:Nitroreductase n=1 Tax=Clostridium saccharoperbutylacetonicum N1-4(HMT) TaxID=931276 RepID=M1MM33_9CLOT|nr:nitroreductase family protein [Clostridium saccharoperbutylacetonicum]AGF55821.1 nitroreductase [Clostridium saccharoperbutylacetonicum N1-4(HMT)]NRT63445.1 nitroreductase/NAD-dependent dihydropyrimidine dehydrogenase PreA subunit [Clostridium saccharoperbutylacetonicum]NSB26807.1 nitroreductase/NAD-dependent dihydropyrimidine dehydrogenase PreA subunit [Clostridium saccharoperbutylacetonicum]NSB40287.1 nitroreductase/NAD-dependent dihydropyrimidine dehydrogenase PreA subunit [Clostridium sa